MPKVVPDIKKDGTIVLQKNSGNLFAFKDKKKSVLMLSIICNNVTVSMGKKYGKDIWKSLCIVEYNQNMECVHTGDSFIYHYAAFRKTVKWFKKLFFGLLNMALLNANSFLQNPSVANDFLQNVIRKINPLGLNFEEVLMDTSELDTLCLELLESLKPISVINSDRSMYYEIKAELLLNFLKDVISQLVTEEQYESQLAFALDTLSKNNETLEESTWKVVGN
ncbi:piggyBac transposable element-derived protein 4 [Nephila pilipes]|uniref:PiggyBac transposable element-derived protein 4 n=1 Tax=Nephila pilipes TaxID=299642 RepID=A0A8X6T9M5_NEPPI|nr:piggyBac transposable element-derived protein 4 [Nephila pilipes]